MNPTEIYDALAEIAAAPFDPNEFPFTFAEATDAAKAAISKLRGSTNKSDLPGGVLFNRKFHYAPALAGLTDVTLEQLRASKKTKASKPAILVATDGETVAAEHPASGDTLHCRFEEIGDNFGFFLPAAGKERYRAVEENPIDVKATGKLARLYDALIKANPDWATKARRHEMNQLMMRLIFCMFAEDVGIFPDNQFSRLIFTHAGDRGEDAQATIIAAFRAMNLPKGAARQGLPFWTAELEYVNGGLFAGKIDAPRFDVVAFRYLREASGLNWREINPDIFGSMIQSVADPKQRSELGMHYTSVPNIMKVIGPLFLDDLDTQIHNAWDKPRGLQLVLGRLSGIRVFDPACGSGNFLVVSYRELRLRETRVLKRLQDVTANTQAPLFSAIPITHFYGIEIADFAAETAKLALFIAEYQANGAFAEVFGRRPAALPLKDAANIRTGNALREDWEQVCPPPIDGQEVFIVGNPPFVGKGKKDDDHLDDIEFLLKPKLRQYGYVDYVGCWFILASEYISDFGGKFAFVSTNSVSQGRQVDQLWPAILRNGREIFFAHLTFKWSNNASDKAAVDCVIIGVRAVDKLPKRIISRGVSHQCDIINRYLIAAEDIPVSSAPKPIFDGIPRMVTGSVPNDGGNLILSHEERANLLHEYPSSEKFLRVFSGSEDFIKGYERWCLVIEDDELREASGITVINARLNAVAALRRKSVKRETRDILAYVPHRFQHVGPREGRPLIVPSVSSERRLWFPTGKLERGAIVSNLAFTIQDAPDWCIALIASRLHLVWIATVCGKLKSDFRYSNTLGWNTFPVPKFSDAQHEALSASAMNILKCRWSHYPKTIADLYDPEKMPDDLRAVHRENDELLETMYIGRPFRNDTERLEKLFKLYAARVKALGAKGGR